MGSVPTSARRRTEPAGSVACRATVAARATGLRDVLAGPMLSGFLRAGALFSGILIACTSVPARTALQSDLPALKAAIAQADRQNRLGSSGARELAGAVLERELSSLAATDGAFPDVAPCARGIRSALEGVASGSSEYSAPAALALIEAGFPAPRTVGDGGAAQAVRARQAVGAGAGA